MKHALPTTLVLATLAAAGLAVAGPLNPPAGPVAATYKTLSDVQPRTAISALPFTVSQSGSYYLTRNLTASGAGNGITVAANDVTIDLNGFALVGVPGDGTAISGVGQTGVVVRNGFIRSWPGHGIDTHSAGSSTIDRVTVTACGGVGILVGPSSVVSTCNTTNNAGGGITAYFSSRVTDCIATSNGSSPSTAGIRAEQRSTVTGCSAVYNTGAGISVGEFAAISGCNSHKNSTSGFVCADSSTVESSWSTENTLDGINATAHVTIRANTCNDNGDDGIQVGSNGTVAENSCHYNGTTAAGAGVYAVGFEARILDNDLCNNRYGVYINGVTLNLVARNCARGHGGGNYTIAPAASNNIAPLMNFSPAPSQWTSLYTWANFAY